MDPTQPSMKAMSMVKIRNNITDRELRRTLGHFEDEKSAAILVIDHDRLDMRDFLRSIKHCGSDELPEARQYVLVYYFDISYSWNIPIETIYKPQTRYCRSPHTIHIKMVDTNSTTLFP